MPQIQEEQIFDTLDRAESSETWQHYWEHKALIFTLLRISQQIENLVGATKGEK